MKVLPTRDDHHREGLTDLDFYRRRAAELRLRVMRDKANFKPVCFGLVLALAWPIALATTASLFHGLHSRTTAQTKAPLIADWNRGAEISLNH